MNLEEIQYDKEIIRSPSKAAQAICDLSAHMADIQACQGDLQELENRGFFKRMVKNNTADLARVLLKQNATMSAFLNIVQGLVAVNLFNASRLALLYDELLKRGHKVSGANRRFLDFAREYISEACMSAQQFKNQLDGQSQLLDGIRTRLLDQDKKDGEQDRVIQELRRELAGHESSEAEHSKNLQDVQKQLEQKEETDNAQTQRIDEMTRAIVALHEDVKVMQGRLRELAYGGLPHRRRLRRRVRILLGVILIYGVAVAAAIIWLLVHALNK
jgi:chromosome segregation ATPase